MRIISKFHDYYDKIGRDPSVLYLREPSELVFGGWDNRSPLPTHDGWNMHTTTGVIDMDEMLIGFCGKVYPLIQAKWRYEYTDKGQYFSGEDVRFCYSADDVAAFLRAHLKERSLEGFDAKGGKSWKWEHRCPHHFRREAFENTFANLRSNPVFIQWFEKAPIWVYDYSLNGKVDFNCKLATLHFQRVFDPGRAHQELMMWLGNIAQPRKAIPVPDDETKAEIHGFDRRTSFRRPKAAK